MTRWRGSSSMTVVCRMTLLVGPCPSGRAHPPVRGAAPDGRVDPRSQRSEARQCPGWESPRRNSRPVAAYHGPMDGEAGEAQDWAWRRRIRSHHKVHLLYRIVIGLVGGAVTVTGIVLIPAPGPGWLVVFLGLAILASEFAWAERLLGFART